MPLLRIWCIDNQLFYVRLIKMFQTIAIRSLAILNNLDAKTNHFTRCTKVIYSNNLQRKYYVTDKIYSLYMRSLVYQLWIKIIPLYITLIASDVAPIEYQPFAATKLNNLFYPLNSLMQSWPFKVKIYKRSKNVVFICFIYIMYIVTETLDRPY